MRNTFQDFIRNISWIWKVPKLAYLHKEIRWVCIKYYIFASLTSIFKIPLILFYLLAFLALCVWAPLKIVLDFAFAVIRGAYEIAEMPSDFFHNKVRDHAKTIRDFRKNNNC